MKGKIMKTMTCKEMGGACDVTFQAETFDDMAILSKEHGTAMFQAQDQAHLKVMEEVLTIMQNPQGFSDWMSSKRKLFDSIAED
jgi:hypothetical protein